MLLYIILKIDLKFRLILQKHIFAYQVKFPVLNEFLLSYKSEEGDIPSIRVKVRPVSMVRQK